LRELRKAGGEKISVQVARRIGKQPPAAEAHTAEEVKKTEADSTRHRG